MEWKMAYARHEECSGKALCTIADVEDSGFTILPARVPGNFELELMEAGLLPDLFESTNTLLAQELEDVHVWYFTRVTMEPAVQYLEFKGIDTYSDIYVNGKHVKSTDNMFLAYEVDADWNAGENEIVVHIKPAMLESRKYPIPVGCKAFRYNHPTMVTRKAASMFGWDIMPRIVSAGIWRPVEVKEKKKDQIKEVYLGVHDVDLHNETAKVRFYLHAELSGPIAREYTVKVEGVCEGHTFAVEERLWHNIHAFNFRIDSCKFWWPKHAGEAKLYNTVITLQKWGGLRQI